MKRSEMVELIQNEFNLVEGMADEILALIEDRGMKPPHYRYLDDDIFDNRVVGVLTHEWEPEDETK